MEIGVFIPIGSNGWLISTTSPQYQPSFELNKQVVQLAEHYDFDFALSMIKLRGFGGPSEFWDHNLESFTLIAGLAAVTEKIKLMASTAVLTLPPALVARMASTIDSIAPGRFGINIVSGWQAAEYEQMGLWPGDQYFGERYSYSEEYVTVMRELWEHNVSDFQGEYFHMQDCKLSPSPSVTPTIVAAGQSDRGIRFAAEHADFNFILGTGINTPTSHAAVVAKTQAAAAQTGRKVGSYVLEMVIAAETDEEAQAKWKLYNDGVDTTALAWMADQAAADTSAGEGSTAATIALPEGAVNLNMGTIVGSYESVARMLDEAASVEGTSGLMLVFDDWIEGMTNFGERIQPLMKSRA